ncbi:MAG: hypothetical protein J3Q66DRAFT_338371 [Benniella sp.]|nr:MAG: hypothetical protein J3Q66DRAFT_338371 [Benniella sp.]
MILTSSSFSDQHSQPPSPVSNSLSSPASSSAASTSQPPTSPHTSPRPGCGRSIPEECLQRIFDYLARDLGALHALLLVSKTFFRIAMPLLYASPFDLIESQERLSPQERIKRHAPLLFLFLNCCSKQREGTSDEQGTNDGEAIRTLWLNLPPICPRFQAAHEALRNPLVDYLSAYHHQYLGMNLLSIFPVLFPNIQRYSPPPSTLSNTMSKPNLQSTGQQQRHQKPEPRASPAMFTRNEIERTFLLHRPETIRTVSLPIQRLTAFPSIELHLAGLVRFELLGISWKFDLGPAIEFVRQHTRLYGTIRELKMAGPNDVRVMQKPKLHEIIQAIKHPRVLDLSRYREAVVDLNSFKIQNVDRLEELYFDTEYTKRLAPGPPAFPATENSATTPVVVAAAASAPTPLPIQHEEGARPKEEGEKKMEGEGEFALIQECLGLTTLQTVVQTSTAFSWAVKSYDCGPASTHLRPKVLFLSASRVSTAQQAVEDCVYAFRDSLEDLKGVSLGLSPVTTSDSVRPPSFGWSWPLTRLSVLSLQGELATRFDMESLRFCPRLIEFRLRLHPHPPTRADFLEKISLAPELKVFSLNGLWIVTDSVMEHLGDGLPKLQSLTMTGCECSALTSSGLKQGLNKMKALKRATLDLGEKWEAVIDEEYRVERPGLEIRGATQDNIVR